MAGNELRNNLLSNIIEKIALNFTDLHMDHNSLNYCVEKLPQFYIEKNKGLYKILFFDKNNNKFSIFVKTNTFPNMLNQEIVALDRLKNINFSSFIFPEVIDSCFNHHSTHPIKRNWIAIKWLNNYESKKLNGFFLYKISEGLVELHYNKLLQKIIIKKIKKNPILYKDVHKLMLNHFSNELSSLKHDLFNISDKIKLKELFGSLSVCFGILERRLKECVFEKVSLCHGDFHTNNILFPNNPLKSESTPVFLDWEYSNFNSPLSDVSHFMSFVSEPQATFFKKNYFEILKNKYEGKGRIDDLMRTCDILSIIYLFKRLRDSLIYLRSSDNEVDVNQSIINKRINGMFERLE